ncbi:MAG TPA: hypothetical protein VKB69_08040 [Micromonosporaceae bacterium]|nr:hypothetical protein [Micromonosporaceae bacterium]
MSGPHAPDVWPEGPPARGHAARLAQMRAENAARLRVLEDAILEAVAALADDDVSNRAAYLRDVAQSIRDHREAHG